MDERGKSNKQLNPYKPVVLWQTFGNELLKEPVNVTIDSTVVLPSATRAGTES